MISLSAQDQMVLCDEGDSASETKILDSNLIMGFSPISGTDTVTDTGVHCAARARAGWLAVAAP